MHYWSLPRIRCRGGISLSREFGMQNTSVKGVQKPVPHYMPSMRARTPTPLKEEFCTPHSRNREVRHALTHSAGRGQHNGERPNGDRCKGDARRIPAITFTVANWGDATDALGRLSLSSACIPQIPERNTRNWGNRPLTLPASVRKRSFVGRRLAAVCPSPIVPKGDS